MASLQAGGGGGTEPADRAGDTRPVNVSLNDACIMRGCVPRYLLPGGVTRVSRQSVTRRCHAEVSRAGWHEGKCAGNIFWYVLVAGDSWFYFSDGGSWLWLS